MCGLFIANTVFADGFNASFLMGAAGSYVNGSTQRVTMNNTTTNQYTVSKRGSVEPLIGLGFSYQWCYSAITTQLGLTGFYTQTSASGINSPDINGGNFDTLNYTATGNSGALMLTPKLIWTKHVWQPYLLAGVGVAVNQLSDYSESQTISGSSAVPTATPFNGATKTNLAYECGVGMQYKFAHNQQYASPIIALDYRFIDWGRVGLSTYTGQPVDSTLSFGQLRTQSVNLRLIYRL